MGGITSKPKTPSLPPTPPPPPPPPPPAEVAGGVEKPGSVKKKKAQPKGKSSLVISRDTVNTSGSTGLNI